MHATDLSVFMENAVAEVLEAMCFISSDGVAPEGTEPIQEDWVCGELEFHGDTSGAFGIAVPPLTAATIASNFLGEEETIVTGKETSEVICELTNMVCGTLLAQVNSKNLFTLSPPRPTSGSVPTAHRDSIHRTYALDEGCIYAWVELRATA